MDKNTLTGLVLHLPVVSHPIVSQLFGANPEIYKTFGLGGHEGIDFACPRDSAVVAAAPGVVWRSGDSPGPWGIRVILKHDFGFTVYAHLNSTMVVPKQTVRADQIIGFSGATGNVTGPHLHFCLALPQENEGYACPVAMGSGLEKFWWHDPLAAGDALFTTRSVQALGLDLASAGHCEPAPPPAEV